jgi:site-specific DNA-methyltransferase (adenine-specific)
MWVYGSGFPKSHDISKAIDKAAGAEREVVAESSTLVSRSRGSQGGNEGWKRPWNQTQEAWGHIRITAPATQPAKLWDGWGTSLKPAWEPVIVAMKPLDGTFAENALKHGVAGMWIDGGRIPSNGDNLDGGYTGSKADGWDRPWKHGKDTIAAHKERGARAVAKAETLGRWPANLILSYPEDEYELRDDVTSDQLRQLAEWMDANA